MGYLDGKSVVITGASSGIGEYLARELHTRGCRLGLLARRAERLEALTEELRAAGPDAPAVAWQTADVRDGAAMEQALDALEDTLGGVDVVVANAGHGFPEPPHRFKPGASIELYDTNMLGTLRLLDWALPRFIERRAGHIVGVASVASYAGMTNSASYCGSKAAMRIHLQGLRVSLKRYGIAVTTICPGFVESELTADARYHMPFLMKTAPACRIIANAMEKRHAEVIFPWPMRLLVFVSTRLVPRFFLEYLMTNTNPPR